MITGVACAVPGPPAVMATAARTTAPRSPPVSRCTPALQVGPGAAAQDRADAVGDALLVPGVGERGPDVLQQRAEDVGGRRRTAGEGVDEVAGEPGAPGPPAGDAQDGRGDGGRRGARARVAGGGLDQAADEPGQGDGVLDAQRDVGGADLDGGPLVREAGVEIDHAGVEDGVGGEHVVDEPVVGGGVGEHLVRAGGGPAVPGLGPEAGVAAVGALPERRVGGERGEHRQPAPDPVEDGDALLVVGRRRRARGSRR